MDLAAIVRRLDVTRARIEAEVPSPGVIAVTSGARGDGKSLVATGLAHALASVGHRVLLVDGNAEVARSSASSAPNLDPAGFDILTYVVAGGKSEPARLGLSAPGVVASCSVDAVENILARLRAHFTYTVIDTAVLVESGMALVLIGESDGVVIAFKAGRAALAADRESAKLLRSSQTPILGIVTTNPKAIRAFNAREPELAMPEARMRTADDATRVARGVRVG